ncbi:hypothetical protein SY2F82_45360 [Streptomyces sp. Y2F8-2]|nr:hypothetical protein SY2F82_45360 [Streptomyces sp. Y2F8-2]
MLAWIADAQGAHRQGRQGQATLSFRDRLPAIPKVFTAPVCSSFPFYGPGPCRFFRVGRRRNSRDSRSGIPAPPAENSRTTARQYRETRKETEMSFKKLAPLPPKPKAKQLPPPPKPKPKKKHQPKPLPKPLPGHDH